MRPRVRASADAEVFRLGKLRRVSANPLISRRLFTSLLAFTMCIRMYVCMQYKLVVEYLNIFCDILLSGWVRVRHVSGSCAVRLSSGKHKLAKLTRVRKSALAKRERTLAGCTVNIIYADWIWVACSFANIVAVRCLANYVWNYFFLFLLFHYRLNSSVFEYERMSNGWNLIGRLLITVRCFYVSKSYR